MEIGQGTHHGDVARGVGAAHRGAGSLQPADQADIAAIYGPDT